MSASAKSEAAKAEAVASAERLRPLFAELAHLGVRRAAEEPNKRKVAPPVDIRIAPRKRRDAAT